MFLGVWVWGQSGTAVKEQGSHDLVSDYRAHKARVNVRASGPKRLEPNRYSILLYSYKCSNVACNWRKIIVMVIRLFKNECRVNDSNVQEDSKC
jgi:hypothetical protein